MGIAKRDFIEK